MCKVLLTFLYTKKKSQCISHLGFSEQEDPTAAKLFGQMACHVVCYYYCAVWCSLWQNRNSRWYLARSFTRFALRRVYLAQLNTERRSKMVRNCASYWCGSYRRRNVGVQTGFLARFSQTVRADSGLGSQIRPQSLLSTPIAVPVHYLVTIVSFDVPESGLLTKSCKNTCFCIICKKVKVKHSRYRPGVAQRAGRGIALLIHDRGTGRW